jgi:hypothetical protein
VLSSKQSIYAIQRRSPARRRVVARPAPQVCFAQLALRFRRSGRVRLSGCLPTSLGPYCRTIGTLSNQSLLIRDFDLARYKRRWSSPPERATATATGQRSISRAIQWTRAIGRGPTACLGAHNLDDPFPLFARVRDLGAVHRVTLADRHTAWLIVRYEEAWKP